MITALQLQIVFIAPQEEWEVFFFRFFIYIFSRFVIYYITLVGDSPFILFIVMALQEWEVFFLLLIILFIIL